MVIWDVKNKYRNLINFGFKYPVRRKNKMSEENGYKKVESNIFKFEKVGDCVEGELLSVEESHTFNNKVYKIKSNEDKTVTFFGTTILDSLMSSVNIGMQIKVLFAGEKENKKKGQNPIKEFEVYYKE